MVSGPSVSVLNLNVWNISEPLEQRMSLLVAGITALKPDIICFQEISPHPKLLRPQSEIVAQACGIAHHRYAATREREGREEGLAILSRFPLANPTSLPLPAFPDDEARQVFICETDIESHRVLIANTHLASPLKMIRERELQATSLNCAIREHRRQASAAAVILCGDFNDEADSPAVQAVLGGGRGRVDAFAARGSESPGHTFTSKNPYVDGAIWPDGRIDYLFVEGELEPVSCRIVFDGRAGLEIASDHFGLFCTLRFSGKDEART